uniref:non-specific serine/threonine protein kinase n=1 Tax=Mycena chlorophos TaxID=658473 RepID=A0ABQ0LPP1_MYCCL|nr:predicted protein [Mycena chlorophos]
MRSVPISRRVQILAAIGGGALIIFALSHSTSHLRPQLAWPASDSPLSPARWLPGYDNGAPVSGEGVAHMLGWESGGEVSEAVHKTPSTGKKPLLLKGPPTTSYKDNLLPDVKYITSWHGDGISNDIMAYMTLLFLAKMTERVPIMDTFFPNPQHVGAGYDAEHQPKNLDFSEAFDIPRFTKLTGVDVLQWSQVKNASTDDIDTLGCWDLESLNGRGPHIAQTIDQLRIDISYTPAPTWAKLNPQKEGDQWSRISALMTLAFPEIYNMTMTTQQPAMSRHLGVELPPDLHLMCFDFLFSTVETLSNDLFLDYSSVWRLVGQHLHFHPKVERLAQQQLRKMFRLSSKEPIPPFISVHVRHNDFQIWCGDQSLEDCFAPFSQYAYRIKRMQKLLLATKGLSVNHVVVTSDENSEEFWAQVASYGYKSPDHSTTKEDHGPFYPFLIDGAILAMGSAIVGTDRSTLSGIAAKRIESWQGGPSYHVRWGGPDVDRDDHPDWGCCKTPGCAERKSCLSQLLIALPRLSSACDQTDVDLDHHVCDESTIWDFFGLFTQLLVTLLSNARDGPNVSRIGRTCLPGPYSPPPDLRRTTTVNRRSLTKASWPNLRNNQTMSSSSSHDAAAPPDFTGLTIDRYELIAIAGTGAFGTVYVSRDTTTAERVAIKCMVQADEGTKAYEVQQDEIALHYAVHEHPNVVSFREHFAYQGYLFLVMEYVEGGAVVDALEHGVFEDKPELAKQAILEMFDAVEHLHKNGIYHRDIKPDNILCNEDGSHFRLADFGLATTSRTTERAGGTASYMPPESFDHTRKYHCPQVGDKWAVSVFIQVSDLLKRCFDEDASKRPTITEMRREIESIESFSNPTDCSKSIPQSFPSPSCSVHPVIEFDSSDWDDESESDALESTAPASPPAILVEIAVRIRVDHVEPSSSLQRPLHCYLAGLSIKADESRSVLNDLSEPPAQVSVAQACT